MKKLLVLLFSILLSFNSYGEWEMKIENINGDNYYIDLDTIKSHQGYVYYWTLTDKLKPSKDGDMSTKMYLEAECGKGRQKYLSFYFYSQPMGNGNYKTDQFDNPKWVYPPPGSTSFEHLNYVCDYVN